MGVAVSVTPHGLTHSERFGALAELWRYRVLIRSLVSRDLRVRYRNSVFGFAWSLINPLIMVAIFTVVFGVILPTPNVGVPYPAFVLPAILAWNFHQAGVLGGMASIVGNAGMITKAYFPREVLPISTVLASAVNFVLALLVLVPMLIVFGIRPSPLWTIFPVIVLCQVLFTTGAALFLAAINVYLRDVAMIVEALMLAWFFLTPVVYDLSGRAEVGLGPARLISLLNPVAYYVAAYREILVTHAPPGPFFLARAAAAGLLSLIIGYVLFLRLARDFGDQL